jgi:hypothetical protein
MYPKVKGFLLDGFIKLFVDITPDYGTMNEKYRFKSLNREMMKSLFPLMQTGIGGFFIRRMQL